MARSVRLAVASTAAACLAACAHAPAGPGDLQLGELGEDLKPAAAAPRPVKAELFSIDTPVGKLCGHPEAKAVVDRDLPGLTARPEYMFFRMMSLRQLQAASNGQMSDADLRKVAQDLAALPPPARRPHLLHIAAGLR